jgi:hypothetical protein
MKNQKKLGPSQITVYNYLDENGAKTAEEVGEALYAITSACAKWKHTAWPVEKIRREWAMKLLRGLVKLGKVSKTDERPARYRVGV